MTDRIEKLGIVLMEIPANGICDSRPSRNYQLATNFLQSSAP